MESQDHKKTSPSGHESHAPHMCHKCGWPFPNPHPSSRHRRAHKKVCGKVEGYKLSESEADNSNHSVLSDDEHHSDGDPQTPSPNGEKTSAKEIGVVGGTGDKSYRSEDEVFSDAVTEFADSGVSPVMEEHRDAVRESGKNVQNVDNQLLKVDAIVISGSLNDVPYANKIIVPESLESAISQSEAKPLDADLDRPNALQFDTSPIKSEIPVDASVQEINATGSVGAKQVLISSEKASDLDGKKDVNSGKGLVVAANAASEFPQSNWDSVVSDTDGNTSNNASYGSKSQEAEGKDSDPLSLQSDLFGADRNFSNPSPVESKLLEADEQAAYSVPTAAKLQHADGENSDSVDLKLYSCEADVIALDAVNVDKKQEELDKVEQDEQRISVQLSHLEQAPNAPIVESKADYATEIDGVSQGEFADSSKTEEGSEDVHLVSLEKDLPVVENPELVLQDFKDYNKFKSSFPLDLGSSDVICSTKDDNSLAASDVSQSCIDTGKPDISSTALDVSGDQVSEEKITVSADGKTDSSGLASTPNSTVSEELSIQNSNGLKELEPLSIDSESLKNSLPACSPVDHSYMDTVLSSSVQEEAKQTTIDDPVIEGTGTSFTMADENKDEHPQNEFLAIKETTLVDCSFVSTNNQTTVSLGGSDPYEHGNARTELPIVAKSDTEKERTQEKQVKSTEGSEGDQTIYPVGGHTDHAKVLDIPVHESIDESFHYASEDSTTKILESAGAIGLSSKLISDADVKETPSLLDNSDLKSHVVENTNATDGLKSSAGVILSPSQDEGDDKLTKQNDCVSAVEISMTSSSRADSLDANWGSVSVLSSQSETTAFPDGEATRAPKKSDSDLQKPTSGAVSHPDKSDVFDPPSFMTLVETGENDNKKAAGSEIETQRDTQQARTEALKAGWFPSITSAVNESQGRKKNEELIAKVTNWSTGKQHTPLKNLLGEAKSPNAKQVPPVDQKDETAAKNNGAAVTTVNSILRSDAPTEQAAASKEVEKEWNSPARYPVGIKKEKKKGKPYWVPFVCCSSVHQDA